MLPASSEDCMELRSEAEFYNLTGLAAAIDERLAAAERRRLEAERAAAQRAAAERAAAAEQPAVSQRFGSRWKDELNLTHDPYQQNLIA